jgi:hypothetical protein
MQGRWARRQGQDLPKGGGGVGRRSRGVSRLISATHGIVDEHAKNCINASASASISNMKTPAPIAPSSNKMMTASTAPGRRTAPQQRSPRPGGGWRRCAWPPPLPRSPCRHHKEDAPPASPSARCGWHLRMPATGMATTTKSEGWRRGNDCRG